VRLTFVFLTYCRRGEFVSLEDLRGKVLLLDFWAPVSPCVASVPAVRDLQRRFAKEPQFKMISVSCNDDEAKWRGFHRQEIKWSGTQYLDRDHHVQRAFGVHEFPFYILVDAEGIVRFHEPTSAWEHTSLSS